MGSAPAWLSIQHCALAPPRQTHTARTAPVCRLAQEASVRGQLYMDTFRRLNLGLVLQTGVTLVVAAQAVSLRNPLLTGD